MLRHLAERLPVMIAQGGSIPAVKPIAVGNVIEYLIGCVSQPATAGLTLDIGGPEIITYRELMEIYTQMRGLRQVIVAVPFLNPVLSSYWISLVTPVPAGIVMPLVEGLKNEVICKDNRILELVPIRLLSMKQAILQCSGGIGAKGRESRYPDKLVSCRKSVVFPLRYSVGPITVPQNKLT